MFLDYKDREYLEINKEIIKIRLKETLKLINSDKDLSK